MSSYDTTYSGKGPADQVFHSAPGNYRNASIGRVALVRKTAAQIEKERAAAEIDMLFKEYLDDTSLPDAK